MKISLNWIKEYTDVDLSVDELVTKIGAQLGAVEEVVDLGAKYQGIIIAKVVSCQKHPNADRLNVCMIDDGGKAQAVERNDAGLVQVVCGAPNIREGLTVAWLPPGCTVPSSFDKDPLVLEARELRGLVSNGMIASPQELAISDEHDGILELDDTAPGADFAETYKLNDYIIDIENKMFTHRPDCFGILGVAREIAGIQQKQFKSPDWYLNLPEFGHSNQLPLTIRNELSDLVPRFVTVVMSEVTIESSPLWLQISLSKVGLKSINNIVDMTNYLMYLTGQPLHAYDYDKVASRSEQGATLVVRHPHEGETVNLLNGKTIQPRAEAIMIATDKELIGIGGVMGGADTEVDQNTKNIIIECANFNMYSIRRTSMAHGLFTDAVTRFNKGQSSLQIDPIIAKSMNLATELSGAVQASMVGDQSSEIATKLANNIDVNVSFINARLGLGLNSEDIENLLKNVEFAVLRNQDKLVVTPPSWRTDIDIREDIVEEVGRLYGFEKLPLDLPPRSMQPASMNFDMQFKSEVRGALARLGANEVLTYSFVHGKLIERTGQSTDLAFKISNALSPDLQYYRMSITPSLLMHVHQNIKSGYDKFALFELGKSHNKLHIDDDNGVPKEYEMLALSFADKSDTGQPAYFQARAYLDSLADYFGIEIEYKPIGTESDFPVTKPFEITRSALAYATGTDIALGIIGEYKASVGKQLKLPKYSAGFEIGLHELMLARRRSSGYKPLSRFPSVSQDICLQVAKSVSYGELTRQLQTSIDQHRALTQTIELQPLDIYTAPELDGQQRITYRITVTNHERTLTEEVVTTILGAVATQLNQSIGAVRI